MNYCWTYDIECPFALSVNSPIPCLATQEQCDEFRAKTKEKTKGKKTYSVDYGSFIEVVKSKANVDPDRKKYAQFHIVMFL